MASKRNHDGDLEKKRRVDSHPKQTSLPSSAIAEVDTKAGGGDQNDDLEKKRRVDSHTKRAIQPRWHGRVPPEGLDLQAGRPFIDLTEPLAPKLWEMLKGSLLWLLAVVGSAGLGVVITKVLSAL